MQALIWVAQAAGEAAASAAAAAGASSAVAAAIGTIATGVALTAEGAALGALAQAMTPRTPGPEAQRVTVRQSIPARSRGCGHARMGGAMLRDFAKGNVLYIVLAHQDCPVSNIDITWLHDDRVRIVSNVVQSLPNGAYDAADERVRIYTTFGQSGVAAFAWLAAEAPEIWNALCYGDFIFMSAARYESPKLEYFNHDYPHGNEPQFNLAGDIDVFYDWRDEAQDPDDYGTWLPSANPVVVLVNELWRHRGYDWDIDFAPTLSILAAEADVCDEAVAQRTNFARLMVDALAGAGSVRLDQVAGLASGMTLTIGGDDYTVSGSPSSDGEGGYTVTLSGSLPAGVPTATVVRWLSDLDDPVTAPRYAANGAWASGEAEADTVKRLLAAMDGFMCRDPDTGGLIIRAGHWIDPTVVIGADELIDYTWQPFLTEGQAVNELACAYVSPAHDYTQVDSQPWRDDDDITARGQVFSQAFAPELVTNNSQVMRLAKAEMSRRLVPVETLRLKVSALRLLGQRWFAVQAGLDELDALRDAVFEVAGDIEIGDNGMSVIVPVRRADPNLYAWDFATEEGEGPADSPGPWRQPLAQPEVTGVTAIYETATGGVVRARLQIAASGPDRSDLNWSYRWDYSDGTAWQDGTSRQESGGTVTITTAPVPAGSELKVAVAYQTGNGVLSDWSEAVTVTPVAGALTLYVEESDDPTETVHSSDPSVGLRGVAISHLVVNTTDASSIYDHSSYIGLINGYAADQNSTFYCGDDGVDPLRRKQYRVRPGSVGFVVEGRATVDNWLSIWYEMNGSGTRTLLDIVEEPGHQQNHTAVSWAGDITMIAGDYITFSVSPLDATGNYYNPSNKQLLNGGLVVTAFNN